MTKAEENALIENLIAALECSANGGKNCSHLCRYAKLEEFPFVCDVEIDGKQYALSCDKIRLIFEGLEVIKSLKRRQELKKDGDV